MHIPRFVRCSLFALLLLTISASSFAGVFISVGIAPPVLPVYEQPPCPGDGYIWTPGYWAYGPDGYYWVPGTWVMPPTVGLLWTPGYWGWGGNAYVWHAGYWGPHIGFYGGVNYGFGYFGSGYEGGYWRDNHFFYNRTVNNIHITNVHIYNRTVINNVTVNRVSYNGGRGGIMARPNREEERWQHERHFEPTHMQMDHEHGASRNREFLERENHGRPTVAATERPGDFHGRGVVTSRPAGNFRQAEDRGMRGRPDSGRDVPRPMPRDDARGNRGGHDNNPRWDNSPRPSSYHPDNTRQDRGRPENVHQEQMRPERGHQDNVRQDNGRGHENAPRNESHGNNGNRGRDERPR
jgi:YXWGXW repeat-containing protein